MSQGAIKKGAIISYISIFLHIAISFVYTPWMINQIGKSDYGLYTLVTSFISYFILDFGLTGSVQRFIAKYRAEGDQRKIENMLGLITKVYLSIDGVIFIILFILFFFISGIFQGLTPEEIEKLKVLYIIAGTFSILSFVFKPMNGAMMAYEFFVESKLIDVFQNVGTVLFIIVVLLSGGGVYELVFVTGFVSFTASLLKFIIFRTKSRIKTNWSFWNTAEMKTLLFFSVWVFLIGLAQRFRLSLMPSVLGVFNNTTEISIFSIGMMIEGMVYTLSSALNGLFLPKVTRMVHNSQNRSEVTTLMIRVGRLQLYISGVILFGFTLIGSEFISLWIGPDFINSYYVALLLISSNIVSLTQSIANDVVYAENKVRYTASFTFISSGLGLLFAILFSKYLGAIGCAIATAFSLWAYLLLANIFYKKTLKLELGRFFKECHWKIIPLQFIVTLCFYGIKQFITLNSWIAFFAYGTIYIIIICLVSYFCLFNNEEKQLVPIKLR